MALPTQQYVNRRRRSQRKDTRSGTRALCRGLLLDHLRKFCLSTSQAGYRYLAKPGLTLGERAFWASVLAVAVSSAAYIIIVEWNFHLARFTITTLAGAHCPVWQVPFPAVTVCDNNKVPLSRARMFLDSWVLPANMTHEEALLKMAYLVELIENEELNTDKLASLQELLELNGVVGENVPAFMRKLTTPCAELLASCRWKGVPTPCEDIFTMRRTYEGYCCSFNYLAINSDIVKHDADMVRKPARRVSSAGVQTGLSVLVESKPAEYHASVMGTFGVKVLIHDPHDYPSVTVMKKAVPVGSEVFLALQPWVTRATASVRSVAVNKRSWRGCLFPDERALALMRRYSNDNCVMECRRNATFHLCGCTPFFYPNDGAVPTCALNATPCLAANAHLLQTMYPGRNGTVDELDHEPFQFPCDCLPDCENYYYPLEDYGGDLATLPSNSRVLFEESLGLDNHSVFHVFFGNFMATHYSRTILYSWYSLLGSFGGLLGLFLGFSLLSGFEFTYFFTFRLFFEFKKKTKIETDHPKKSKTSKLSLPFFLTNKKSVPSIQNTTFVKPFYHDSLY